MEKNHGNENKLSIFICEAVGTAILSLSLNLAWTQNNIIEAYLPATQTLVYSPNVYNLYVMAGACLYSVFYIFSPVSGGHFNPAVTLAVYISLAFTAHNLILATLIVTAQLLGAIAGMLLSRGLRVKTDGLGQAAQYPEAVWFGSVSTLVNPGHANFQVFAMETWCTFMFVLVVLVTMHQ